MRTILTIAYIFPPLGGGGVQRTLKFVKYLTVFGWQPVVLTGPGVGKYPTDTSLFAELPQDLTIQRTYAWLLPGWLPWRLRKIFSRWLLLGDDLAGWYTDPVLKGTKLIKTMDIQALYTTSAPIASHAIGKALKQFSGLPWIADFRDPWIGNFSQDFATRWHEQAARRREKEIVKQADRVLVVSEPMRQAFLNRYPSLSPARFITLPNGFDPDDFRNLTLLPQRSPRFTIVYSGSFYGQQQTPRYFLEGLKIGLDEKLLDPQQILVRFIGNTGKLLKDEVDRLALQDVVEIIGYLPHRQSLAYLISADLLLLIIGSGPGSQAVTTGKIYEYLASRRPILALASPGAATEIIREAQAGMFTDPQDIGAIAVKIVQCYHLWRQHELSIQPIDEVINRYDRRELTAQLARILTDLVPMP